MLGLVKCTLFTSDKYCGMMNDGNIESKEFYSLQGASTSSMLFVHFIPAIIVLIYRGPFLPQALCNECPYTLYNLEIYVVLSFII